MDVQFRRRDKAVHVFLSPFSVRHRDSSILVRDFSAQRGISILDLVSEMLQSQIKLQNTGFQCLCLNQFRDALN